MEHGVRALWAVIVIGTLKALLEREAGRCEISFCGHTLCWPRRSGQLVPLCYCITIDSEFDLVNVLDVMEIISTRPFPLLRKHALVASSAAYAGRLFQL